MRYLLLQHFCFLPWSEISPVCRSLTLSLFWLKTTAFKLVKSFHNGKQVYTNLLYTERKKKRNTKFDIELQNYHWIYVLNLFTTWTSNLSLITIWQTIGLCFKSCHKAISQLAIPHTKSEEETLSKVWNFCKISLNDIGDVRFLFASNVL